MTKKAEHEAYLERVAKYRAEKMKAGDKFSAKWLQKKWDRRVA